MDPDEDQINLVSNGAVFRAMVGRETTSSDWTGRARCCVRLGAALRRFPLPSPPPSLDTFSQSATFRLHRGGAFKSFPRNRLQPLPANVIHGHLLPRCRPCNVTHPASRPILPDVSGVFAANAGTSLTLEQRFSDPATMPSIETLLAMPSGFRAAGYDALTISSSKSTAGDL